MAITISIEGNIGVGKSSFIDILKKNFDCEVVPEPVQMWLNIKDTNNKNILQTFYDDITRWGYTFQNVAFITKMMELEKLKTKGEKIYIVERSPITDRNCFAELCFESGFMTEMEWQAYNMWYNHYIHSFEYDGFIYLKAEPERCLERINTRNRGEETSISIDYLNSLHQKHQLWLDGENKEKLYLDDNYTLDTIHSAVQQVLDFMNA